MERAHTTDFIFDNGEFFVANTTIGNIRVGMNFGRCFDVSAESPFYEDAAAANDADKAENVFDLCMDYYS